MAAGELAKQKGLGIAAGTQRRHSLPYREAIKRIQDGAIGDIVYAKCYWNGGEIWVIEKEPSWSDLEWQLRNWNYFTWLAGDHIVEQHVHNLDVMNWVLGAHPIKAVSGLGGRQVRVDDKFGNIFDHFAIEFEYPNGVSMFSQCRQINGCLNKVEEFVMGTNGVSNCQSYIGPKTGASPGRCRARPSSQDLPVPAGASELDRQHPGRQPDQRSAGRGGEYDDRNHGTRGRVQRPGSHVGSGHAVHHASGSRQV